MQCSGQRSFTEVSDMVLYIWKYRWTGERGEFTRIAVIDNACSVIWVRRFQTAGEFEVYVPASKKLLQTVRQNDREVVLLPQEKIC